MKNVSLLSEYLLGENLFSMDSKSANEVCNLMEESAYVELRIHIGS